MKDAKAYGQRVFSNFKGLQKYGGKAHGFNRGMRARKLFANYRSMMSNRVEMLYR